MDKQTPVEVKVFLDLYDFNIDVYCNWLEGLRTAIHTNMLDELQESSSKGKKARLIIIERHSAYEQVS